jgi:hypothetical protein
VKSRNSGAKERWRAELVRDETCLCLCDEKCGIRTRFEAGKHKRRNVEQEHNGLGQLLRVIRAIPSAANKKKQTGFYVRFQRPILLASL